MIIFLLCTTNSLILRSSRNTHLTHSLVLTLNTLHVAMLRVWDLKWCPPSHWSSSLEPEEWQFTCLAQTFIPFPLCMPVSWNTLSSFQRSGVSFIFWFCHHPLHPALNKDFSKHWNAYHVPDTEDTMLRACEIQLKKVNSHGVTESSELCEFGVSRLKQDQRRQKARGKNSEPHDCLQPLPYLRSLHLLDENTYIYTHTYIIHTYVQESKHF